MNVARYCPNGDGVFEDWVEKCPECGRPLDALPPREGDSAQHTGEIAWLVTAPNEPEAMMWAETLRGEGIAVMLRPGGPGAGAWGSSATFEHDLFVLERDHERALQIVRSVLTGGGAITRPESRRLTAPRIRPVRKGASSLHTTDRFPS